MIYEGNIITCDNENHVYRYLVEENGRIAYVGDELPEQYKGKEIMVTMQPLMKKSVVL